MTLTFSDRPGPRERQLRRKYCNPLFDDAGAVTFQTLTDARRQDLADAEAFREEFLELVKQAVNLPPQADSEVVLSLKERLDKAYERACGLAGDQSRPKEAIRKLLGVIMKAVWKGAGNDPLAHQELEQEDEARRLHFALVEQPLIADLLSPDNPIPPEQLAPTLLSESEAAVKAALSLFQPAQLEFLCGEARQRLERLEGEGVALTSPRALLELMEGELATRISPRAH